MAGGINRVEVKIVEDKYVLKSELPSEYLIDLAQQVDRRIREIIDRNPRLPLNKAAVLTAINLVNELTRLQENYDSLVKLIETGEDPA